MPTFQNPVVRGHAPDPSVIRVGEDFYLANSSFRYLPGIPILHSRDLVNWQTVGFAVSRPAQYRRDGEPGEINLFAPTLRYYDGVFYLICTNEADNQGNFYVTATDPAGPWSDAIWVDREAFDPSLFRDDDGQWYYLRRSLEFGATDGALGPFVQANIDIKTGELGEMRPITANRRGFSSNDIEGAHLYRRGDWYYLFAAEGSSWKGHMQTIGRSRSPWGPFEPAPHNPVLTHAIWSLTRSRRSVTQNSSMTPAGTGGPSLLAPGTLPSRPTTPWVVRRSSSRLHGKRETGLISETPATWQLSTATSISPATVLLRRRTAASHGSMAGAPSAPPRT
ncbi:glycoside hydrolase family 43 protein [Paenarthrobacter sp. TYUT067]|uniref:glycoside hydrolase family 43 protein n=1 Tax=Paenarthrobacter sp. TYUT067 TaxID=2926245 RepID=UPI00202E0897|nr:glycoside hydrolase family 43 protein [Paenarthrobacter sp. TYUT067]MCM0616893.1 glycoside hydrolase family 43 protein [Paenarthrobacter sp. TYUT067]